MKQLIDSLRRLRLIGVLLALFVAAWPVVQSNAGELAWKLKYTEDFKGQRLNPKLWKRLSGTANSGPDWQRNVSPRPDLVVVKDGVLLLKGVRNTNMAEDPRRVLAGGVSTSGLFNMKYGKLEIRAKLEGQTGAWPAIWMMPQNPVGIWPECGEIDILEHLNYDDFVYQTVHSTWAEAHPNNPPNGGRGAIKVNDWNVYTLEWLPNKIVWRVNGKMTHSYARVDGSHERWPWDVPFYLMIDMQLGGNWVGGIDESTLPVTMHIDWIKFYQLTIEGRRISSFTRPGRE